MKKLINLIFVFTLLFLVSCNKEKNTKTDIVPVEKPKDSIVQVEKKIVEKNITNNKNIYKSIKLL